MSPRWLSVLALCACSSGHSKPPRAAPRDCVRPEAFGAIPDDGQDDREAVQAAIDAAAKRDADVCLPAGELSISRKPGKIASLEITRDGTTVRGEGPSSRLAMLDRPDDDDRRDWWVIKLSGNDQTLRDFAMDGEKRGVTDEQTHLIQIFGPARRVRIEALELSLPVQDISRGGDCIRLLGEKDARVEYVTITHVTGTRCARSFIAFQRFVQHVVVDHVSSIDVKNSAIDMEPSGDGTVEDVTIKHANLRQGRSGSYTASLAGSGDLPSKNLVIEDSTIEGSIQIFHVHGATLQFNRIYEEHLPAGASSRALVTIHQDSRDVRIDSNVLVRSGAADAGIAMLSHNGAWPHDVRIRNNEITLNTEGYAITAEPVEQIDIADNTISCGDKNGSRAAIYFRGVLNPIRGVRIRKNEIRGTCAAAVQLTGHGDQATGDVLVEDNRIEGPRSGVVFENGAPRIRPVIDRNVFRGVPTENQVVGASGFQGRNQ